MIQAVRLIDDKKFWKARNLLLMIKKKEAKLNVSVLPISDIEDASEDFETAGTLLI